MKILVIGASGYLGSAIEAFFSERHEVVGTRLSKGDDRFFILDTTSEDKVSDVVYKIKPDLIIHAANLIDECFQDAERARRVNIDGTKNVLTYGEEIGAKFVFISSAAVFDGKAGKFSELDIPQAKTLYGQLKIEAENLVRSISSHYLIVRPSLVVGKAEGGINKFYNRTIASLFTQRRIQLDSQWKFNPSWIQHINTTINWWLNTSSQENELLHVASAGVTTKRELVQSIADRLGLNVVIEETILNQGTSSTPSSRERILRINKETEKTVPHNILDVSKLKELGIETFSLEQLYAHLVKEIERGHFKKEIA